jgi:hypothetical protein
MTVTSSDASSMKHPVWTLGPPFRAWVALCWGEAGHIPATFRRHTRAMIFDRALLISSLLVLAIAGAFALFAWWSTAGRHST